MVHLEARRPRGHGGSYDIDTSVMNEFIYLVFTPPDIASFVIIALYGIVFLGSIVQGFRHGWQSIAWIFIASSFGITSGTLCYIYGRDFESTRTTQLIVLLCDGFTWIALYDIICSQRTAAQKSSKWHRFMFLSIVVCMVMDALPLIEDIGAYIIVVGIRLTLWWIPTFFAIYYVCQKYIKHRRSLIAIVVCMGAMPFGRTLILGLLWSNARGLALVTLWAVFDHMLPTIGLFIMLVHLHKFHRTTYYNYDTDRVSSSEDIESRENK